MANLNNRQNLTPEEAANAVEVYNSAGRLDTVKTNAANNDIFHVRNVVIVNLGGALVKDVPATVVKAKAARDKFLSDNR
jgi:hypothetical protein